MFYALSNCLATSPELSKGQQRHNIYHDANICTRKSIWLDSFRQDEPFVLNHIVCMWVMSSI